MDRQGLELQGRARKELAAWLAEQGRWQKNEPRPGMWIDNLPSSPPALEPITPALATAALYGDATVPEQHWQAFLALHPMISRLFLESGIREFPQYGHMPGDNFPAFRQRLAEDLTAAFGEQAPDRRRRQVLGMMAWTAVYAEVLAIRGDDKARRNAGELLQMLADFFYRFHNPALAKDMPLACCLALEMVWPGLPLCPSDDLQKQESLIYAVDRAFLAGKGLQVPSTVQNEWEQARLTLCKWRLETRISRHDEELAARELAYAYAAAGDHGRAIQYYHQATQANPESPRNYVPLVKVLLTRKYSLPEAEQRYLAYLKLLSRSGLASKGGTKALLQGHANECKAKGQWEQAIGLLQTMDPYRWDRQTRREIAELKKKLPDKGKALKQNKRRNQDKKPKQNQDKKLNPNKQPNKNEQPNQEIRTAGEGASE